MTQNATNPATTDNHDWEREFAPRVSRTRLILVCGVFAAWIAFLAWASAERWFHSLQ